MFFFFRHVFNLLPFEIITVDGDLDGLIQSNA